MGLEDASHCLFFGPLQTKDVTSRLNFLEELEKVFEPEEELTRHLNGNNNDNDAEDHSLKYPVLLRLSHECPFSDVRISCTNILQKLEENGVRVPRRKFVGPSKFISAKECVQIDSGDENVQLLFFEAFLNNGRVSHIDQLLGYHIRYLSCFLEFESALMKSNGPLHTDWCFFIGLLGASRHNCDILMELCKRDFIMMGGNPSWLEGLEKLPVKLKKLHELNKCLAHQPWRITVELIKNLMMSGAPQERWTTTELVHAIIILVHYQSLSGLVFGCGVTPEIDSPKGRSRRSPSSGDYSSGSEPLTPTKLRASSLGSKSLEDVGTTAQLFDKIQKAKLEEENEDSQDLQKEDEKLRQFQEVETKELDDENDSTVTVLNNNLPFTNSDLKYEDFAKRKQNDIEVFRAQDYNWSEHCFSFINRICPEMGTLLDNKFQCAYDLTYNTMGESIKDVDTSKFRLATWNYIHLVYGIFHDDYVYYEVNKLLEKSYKSYVKKVACFPERIVFTDYWDFYSDLLPSEKVHINLLVLESRMQAILLYASRAVMKCMNEQ